MINVKFSVIIPYLNGSEYIEKCLQSVENQNYLNYEIIIVNNGSNREEVNYLKKISKNDKIKIITLHKKGLGLARNVGISKSNGDYILFLDCDDTLNQELFLTLNKEINHNPDVEVIKYNAFRKNGNKITGIIKGPCFELVDGKVGLEKLLDYKERIFSPVWLYCISKNVFLKNKIKFSKCRYHEDYGFTSILLMNVNKFMAIDFNGYNYLQNYNGIIRTTDYKKIKKKCNDFIYHSFKLIKISSKKIESIELKNKFFRYVYNQSERKIKYLNLNDKKLYTKKLKKLERKITKKNGKCNKKNNNGRVTRKFNKYNARRFKR